MRSMTGYGRGVAEQGGVRATVDVRSVNHRFLDLKLRGPSIAPALEEAISIRIRGLIERGAVAVSVHVANLGVAAGTRIDPDAARRAHATLTELAARLAVAPPDLALVLAQPGVVRTADDGDADAGAPPVIAALDGALAQLDQMRTTEGHALAAELRSRFDQLAALRTALAALAATVPQQVSRRLHERVRRLLDTLDGGIDADGAPEEPWARRARPEDGAPEEPWARRARPEDGAPEEPWARRRLDPARLAQEVALLADRADVTEELVRLASHIDQSRALLGAPGAVGRRLDFLVQEIGRELNTIGSKSALAEISVSVVDAKAVLEKVREQVQNVE